MNLLKNRYIEYNNITILQIFQHLYSMYGRINEYDLQENEERMRILQNLEDPIETIF